MTITFPLLTVVDDSGAIVSGATVTVSSLTDKSGTAKSTSLATVNVAGPNVSVDYDAAGNGEAWITLSISAAGHTFTNSNATPSFYLPADSSRVLGSIPASSAGAAGGLLINGSDQAVTFTALTITGAMTISGGMAISNSAGDALALSGSGHGLSAVSTGTNKHGIYAAGGTSGVCDGLHLTAGTGGVDLRAAMIQGDLGGRVVGNTSTAIVGVGVQATLAAASIATATFAAGATIPYVNVCNTLTTYTNNTPQSGDAYARLGAPAGASVSADIASVNSNVSGLNSAAALIRVSVPDQFPLPGTGTTTFELDILLYDAEGHNENADGASNGIGSISVTAKNAAGTSRSSQLGSVTWISTGHYSITYTVNSTDAAEQLIFAIQATVNSNVRTMTATSIVAAAFATSFNSTDRTNLTNLATYYTSQRAGYLDNLNVGGPVSTFAGGAVASVTAAVQVGSYATGQSPAEQVLGGSLAAYTTPGTGGYAISHAAAAGDPWLTVLPGSYAAGTAGAILGGNLDAKVSTRSTYAGGAVASVTAPVTVGTNNDKTGYSLAAAGLDAVAVESGVNLRQACSVMLAAAAGVVAGAGTGTITIAAANGPSTNRITATTDSVGDRTAVTLNLPV